MALLNTGLERLTGWLFFKPVGYTLPRGTPGIRNPLLQDCIWPWFAQDKRADGAHRQ